MIRGVIRERLEPIVDVEISNGDGEFQTFEALLDTGFGGDLTLPPDAVARLGLKRVGQETLTLADGQDVDKPVYRGFVKWLGRTKTIHVIATDGLILLGMTLLKDCKITIRARPDGEVLIEEDSEA